MEGENKWSNESEEILIDLWQESPCLYEISSKDYANKIERKKAVDNMAMKLSISGETVNKRLHALKAQHTRIWKPAPSGSGSVKMTGRQTWLKSKLQFLKSAMKITPTTSNVTIEDAAENAISVNDCSTFSKDYGSDIEPDEDNSRNDEPEPVIEISRSATGGLNPPAKKRCLGPLKRLKAKQNDEELAILKTLAQAVATPGDNTITTVEKTDDEDDAFGRFIVTEMKSICDFREKLILKNMITNAIFNTKMKTFQTPFTPQPVLSGTPQIISSRSPHAQQYNSAQPVNEQAHAQVSDQTGIGNMYDHGSTSFSQMLKQKVFMFNLAIFLPMRTLI